MATPGIIGDEIPSTMEISVMTRHIPNPIINAATTPIHGQYLYRPSGPDIKSDKLIKITLLVLRIHAEYSGGQAFSFFFIHANLSPYMLRG